ncbi:A Mitochondrial tumor suppressor 1 -like protein [Triplophysa tibetana]|uniref:A Mitochondrial tumor suppressor 1-like protein n=1 Tax=Triplophysa tibetana TaxID=1572043 RepID=A0A5A9NIU9_9TELE|nr:A Mitochondrial tumor suppressor 1 -like protein [Triplophysa tibetana]
MEITHNSINLTFSIEDKNGNNITCPTEHSPNSVRSSSSWSCGSADSPPDVEMEDCISDATSKKTLKIRYPTTSGSFKCTEVVSYKPSRRGSSENCCSVSSSEMVMRSNSFILHETDQPLNISVLGKSRTSLDISSDIGVVSGMLPDVCEGLREEHPAKLSTGESKNRALECTFIQPGNQTFLIEGDLIQLPDIEKHECATPVHQKSSKDVQKLPCNTGGSSHSTPVEGKTVHLTALEDLDISGNAQTSTPVQSVSNKTFCLPPLSESPLQKDEGDSVSPMAQIINRQEGDASPKPKSLMANKSKKVEIKRFPKPNFSNIKSKIISRASNPFKTSSAPKTSSSTVLQANECENLDRSAQRKSSPNKSTSLAVINTYATPARHVKSSVAVKRTRSSTCQESGLSSKSRPRRWSESATPFRTTTDGSQEKNQRVNGALSISATPQTLSKGSSQNKDGKIKPDRSESSKKDSQGNESLKVRGKNLKISLMAVSAKLATGSAACEWSRGRLGPQPSPARTGGASAARIPGPFLRPPFSAASKIKLGTAGKDDSNTLDMPSPRVLLCTPEGGAQSRTAQFTAPSTLSASKLPIKPKTQAKTSSVPHTNGHPKQDQAETSLGALSKHSSNRTTLCRSKLQSPSTRSVPSVDRNKSKTASRNLQPPPNGQPDLVPPESKSRSVEYYKVLCEKKNQTIQQLENTVRSDNRRFEAVAVVIKHLYAEHEEVMKQRRELCQELSTLREELVSSAQSCERLEEEKEELRGALDGVLQKVQEQHRLDLADLEERLKTFYSTEWEKVHQTYQEEADKCKAQMEQQLEELRSKHEVLKKELEDSHVEEVDNLKLHFDESFKELKQSQEKEIETLNSTLKKSEEILTHQIQELIAENNNLKEKLKAEEIRRKDLAERTQDSHTLYLEQELESLKVVLDIKNKRIHEHDKKLMQIDKLMDRNVKLDECLKKVQQENEDLKARMDKHAALSRQLSSDQAVLQESLQKESKVNKRLSMENEELHWKLHNGDLSSPRKVSPSTSLTLQSPRNSGIFSSPSISPR